MYNDENVTVYHLQAIGWLPPEFLMPVEFAGLHKKHRDNWPNVLRPIAPVNAIEREKYRAQRALFGRIAVEGRLIPLQDYCAEMCTLSTNVWHDVAVCFDDVALRRQPHQQRIHERYEFLMAFLQAIRETRL